MIFMLAAEEPTIMLLLNENDLQDLRKGLTKFANFNQIEKAKDKSFNHVILGYFKTQEEILAAIKKKEVVEHGILPGQEKCKFCDSIVDYFNLLDGGCIACWRERAIKAETQSN